MRYEDLRAQTLKLSVGRHPIYGVEQDAVFIENIGQRHPHLPEQDVLRLVVRWNGRILVPRPADLFTDLRLKMEARPEFRRALLESCEQIAKDAAPSQLFAQHQFPRYFRDPSPEEWSRQTSVEQAAGLPTLLFLCALQVLILVYDHNEPKMNAPDLFRRAFTRLEAGDACLEVAKVLVQKTPVGKRYYDLSIRT